jgi:hypothetical protein
MKGLGLTKQTVVLSAKNIKLRPSKLRERKKMFAFVTMFRDNSLLRVSMKSFQISLLPLRGRRYYVPAAKHKKSHVTTSKFFWLIPKNIIAGEMLFFK